MLYFPSFPSQFLVMHVTSPSPSSLSPSVRPPTLINLQSDRYDDQTPGDTPHETPAGSEGVDPFSEARMGSDDDGEDLLGDDAMQDYRAIPELDRYDRAGVDDEFEDGMSQGEAVRARMAAEEAMDDRDARDGRKRRGRRLPGALDGETERFDY